MIRNLVFDIGGVIIDDSNRPLEKVLGLLLDELEGFIQWLYSNSLWSDGVMLGRVAQQEYMIKMIQECPKWEAEIQKCLSPEYQPEVLPVLSENLDYILNLKSKYNLYLLSNLTDATYHYLEKVLAKFDGGIFSFREHTKKPEPEIYQALFRKYCLEPTECVFFDDRPRNLEAGEKLGMRGILVQSLEDLKVAESL